MGDFLQCLGIALSYDDKRQWGIVCSVFISFRIENSSAEWVEKPCEKQNEQRDQTTYYSKCVEYNNSSELYPLGSFRQLFWLAIASP